MQQDGEEDGDDVHDASPPPIIDEDNIDDERSAENERNADDAVAELDDGTPAGSQQAPDKTEPQPKGPTTLPLLSAARLDDRVVIADACDTSLDLSGDVGTVGRLRVFDTKLVADLKGVMYDGFSMPCNSLWVVNIGDADAKVTAAVDECLVLCEGADVFKGEDVTAGNIDFMNADDGDDNNDGGAAGSAAAAKSEKGAGRKRKLSTGESDDGPVALSGAPIKRIRKKVSRKSTSGKGRPKKKR